MGGRCDEESWEGAMERMNEEDKLDVYVQFPKSKKKKIKKKRKEHLPQHSWICASDKVKLSLVKGVKLVSPVTLVPG